MIIIGLAGTFAAGKDIGAEYLAKKLNLSVNSTSDVVRQISMEKFGSVKRHTLQDVADQARAEHGAGFLVKQAIESFDKSSGHTGLVITGIRSIGEAEELLKQKGTLIFIDAPRELRFERTKIRHRKGDERTFKEFCTQEDRELTGRGNDKTVINLNAVKSRSHTVIVNDGNLDEYYTQLDEALRSDRN